MESGVEPSRALEALRHAARAGRDRYLVGVPSADERQSVAQALVADGAVITCGTQEDFFRHLADEPFDIAFLDVGAKAGRLVAPGRIEEILSRWRERRPFSDLVLIGPDDPETVAEIFAAEASAVLPRPLPEVEALFRAHVRRLAAGRRARTRGLLVVNAYEGHVAPLAQVAPALAAQLEAHVAASKADPVVGVIGDVALARAVDLSSRDLHQAIEAVVVAAGADDEALASALQEAREHAPGAAIVLVDDGPSPERVHTALYGGVRAYLPRARVDLLGRIVASTASRRRAETVGGRLLETLAQNGALPALEKSQAQTLDRHVDVRLIADAVAPAPGRFVVPTAHEVLVVDDEAVVLTVLREALRRGGYRVTTAASAEEAIDLMRKRRFDLVLTDKNLPGASGLEVVRVARDLPSAPAIVLITGYSSFDSAVEAMDIGALDYIEKPISDVEDLRQRVRRALSRREEQMARPRLAPNGRSGRVLLVETEGSRRQLIADYLGKTYQVTAVENGDEALAVLKRDHFDLVLADRHLPGVSGLRVIEHAQSLLPHCASVLYTAYPSYESVKEAFASGVDAYLVRPSEDLKKLGEKVAEALGGRGGILLG